MSRVINRNNYSTQRNSYLRFVSTAVKAYDPSKPGTQSSKDIILFIYLTLKEVELSLEKTTQPWEKRGYWVKVEQFMHEWNWIPLLTSKLLKQIEAGKWKQAGEDILSLRTLAEMYPPFQRMKIKEPWKGAYIKWKQRKKEAGR